MCCLALNRNLAVRLPINLIDKSLLDFENEVSPAFKLRDWEMLLLKVTMEGQLTATLLNLIVHAGFGRNQPKLNQNQVEVEGSESSESIT